MSKAAVKSRVKCRPYTEVHKSVTVRKYGNGEIDTQVTEKFSEKKCLPPPKPKPQTPQPTPVSEEISFRVEEIDSILADPFLADPFLADPLDVSGLESGLLVG